MDYHLFGLFFSVVGTPTCKLANLTTSTANEYTGIDSFHFAEEIGQQDSNLHMASPGVDSLFTNIPLDKTIDICADNLHNSKENLPITLKHGFCNLLKIATKESFFLFNNKYHKQLNGVAMGSPLGPALANHFHV